MVKLNQSDSGPRLYRGEGFAVPSVTTVLQILEKRYLEAWRHRVGRKEADRVMVTATVLGTQVHSLANKLIWEKRAGATKVPESMKLYALALRSFFAGHVAEPIKTELSLVSERERVGGTLDLYARMQDGSYAICDYKTSAQLSREHGLQTALYALLLREYGYNVQKRLVVRIKKDRPGEFYVREYNDHAGDVKAARACVDLWHWQNASKLKKVADEAL